MVSTIGKLAMPTSFWPLVFLTTYLGWGARQREASLLAKELRLLWGTGWQHFCKPKLSKSKNLLTKGQLCTATNPNIFYVT